MNKAIRMLLARPGRNLAVLGSVLAVAAATAVSLRTESNQRPEYGVPQHPTGVPSAPTKPGEVAPANAPIPTPTSVNLPTAATPGPPVVARTSAAGHTISTPAPTTTSAGAKEPEDLLKRQDPVPDGVPEQVEFFLGGGREDPVCTGQPGAPYITGADKIVEIPTALVLCFYGFKESMPLIVTFAGPSRSDTTVVLRSTEHFFWTDFRLLPTDPVGLYSVKAEQYPNIASLEFTLQHAVAPRLWLVPPSEPPHAGVDVDLYLGGFPPNSPTLLHLYDANTSRYRTSFTADIDAFGEAHVVIDTKPDDPPGCYGIISALAYKPGDKPETGFCIR